MTSREETHAPASWFCILDFLNMPLLGEMTDCCTLFFLIILSVFVFVFGRVGSALLHADPL